MKRSKAIKLTLMASAPLVLAACGDPQTEGAYYASLAACESADRFSDSECRDAYESALNYHATAAPRFVNQGLCEGLARGLAITGHR